MKKNKCLLCLLFVMIVFPLCAWTQDSIPPELSILCPYAQEGETPDVPAEGFAVEGTVYDVVPSCAYWMNTLVGVEKVLVRVYDMARQEYTVLDKEAAYSEGSGIWEFFVEPEDVSAGAQAVIGVQGIDRAGNAGIWQYQKVNIGEVVLSPVPDKPSHITMEDGRLVVAKRKYDAVAQESYLTAKEPYSIKGVTWAVAARAPTCGPNPQDPSQCVPYGFFFDGDWRLPGPQGHEIYGEWIKGELARRYVLDIPLMKKMGVNTVRTFIDAGLDPKIFQPVFDELYRNGIMAIVTVAYSKDQFLDKKYLDIVKAYKNHPAILMWSLGNEWNLEWDQEWLDVLKIASQEIKNEDPDHLVTTAISDLIGFKDFYSQCEDSCGIDLWGLNVYRSANFGSIFDDWRAMHEMPFYFSEFGTDSYRSETFDILTRTADRCAWAPNGCAVNVSGEIDEGMQAAYLLGVLDLIDDNADICLGAVIHGFNDQLLWAGNYNMGMGGIIDYNGPDGIHLTADDDSSYDEYNTEGFYMPGSHPDNVSNEEYFGLVDADRDYKLAFHEIAARWRGKDFELLYPTAEDFVPVREDLNVEVQLPSKHMDSEVRVSVIRKRTVRRSYPKDYTVYRTEELFSELAACDSTTGVCSVTVPGQFIYETWFRVPYIFSHFYWDIFLKIELIEDGTVIDLIEQDIVPDYDMTPPSVEMRFPDYASIDSPLEEGAALKVRIQAVDSQSGIRDVSVQIYGGYPYKYPVWSAHWDEAGAMKNIAVVSDGVWELTIPGSKIVRFDNPWGAGDWTPDIRVRVWDNSPYFMGNETYISHTLNVDEDRDNHAPVIITGPQADFSSIFENETTALRVQATDEDGDILSYFWRVSAGALDFYRGDEAVYTPPDVDEETVINVWVSVCDTKETRVWGTTSFIVKPLVIEE